MQPLSGWFGQIVLIGFWGVSSKKGNKIWKQSSVQYVVSLHGRFFVKEIGFVAFVVALIARPYLILKSRVPLILTGVLQLHYAFIQASRSCSLAFFHSVKYSLQGTTQGRYLTGGVPPVRFSM